MKNWPVEPVDSVAKAGLDAMAKQLGIEKRLELEREIADLKRELQHKTYMIAVMINMQGGKVVISRKDVEAVETGMLHEHRDIITDSITLTMETDNAGISNNNSQA